jgi:hypothetical protein
MKTIATFGCSYTAGHGTSGRRWVNWPCELAIMLNDQVKVVNCAKGGTSIDFSVHALETLLKEQSPDIVLFQVTSPSRFTFLPDIAPSKDIFDLLQYQEYLKKTKGHERVDRNYRELENMYRYVLKDDVEWGFFTPGNTTSPESDKKLAKLYYKNAGIDRLEYTKFNAYFNYIKTLCKDIPHLILSHDLSWDRLVDFEYIDIDFKVALGEDYFNSKVIDEGKHLSHVGIIQIAKLLNAEIQKRNLL